MSEYRFTSNLFRLCDRTGGIPAQNSKGERLLVYIGIIDILQSYRLVALVLWTNTCLVLKENETYAGVK